MARPEALVTVLCGSLLAAPGARPPAAADPVAMADLAARHGLTARGDASRLTLAGRGRTLVFEAGSRRVSVDGRAVWMNAPAAGDAAGWSLRLCDARAVIEPLLNAASVARPAPPVTVVLDPGHGGRQAGARRGADLTEKRLVLDIAKRVRRRLTADGYTVHLTRARDTDLPLADRAAACRAQNGDVFVSIHLNFAVNAQAQGIETYALPAAGFPSTAGGADDGRQCRGNLHDASNTALAFAVHSRLLAATGADDRGLRRARFDVLRDIPCPAILVECGFLSNAAEAGRLALADYRQTVAAAIAQGIADFSAGESAAAR